MAEAMAAAGAMTGAAAMMGTGAAGARSTAVIVMAGRREVTVDPLADRFGLSDKCLVPVAGRPMIARVLETLAETPGLGRIVVSVNQPEVLDGLPVVADLARQGRLTTVAARANLVDSLLGAIEVAGFPVLVTTADNVLLSSASITEFLAGAACERADVAAAFARKDAVLAAHPDGQRRFYRFRDDSYSNCNVYWIGRGEALKVAEVFRSGGQFAKHPMRIVKAFGLLNLIRLRYGIGTLQGAFAKVSKRFRVAVRPVVLTDGAAAIDVDNDRTLAVTETILARTEPR